MKLRLGIQIFLFFRHMHYIPQRSHRPGNNGDLLHRLGIFLQSTDQGVTHFMIGNDLPFLFTHDPVLLLFSHKDDFHRVEQIFLTYISSAFFYRIDGSFIDHIGQVRPYRTACRKSNRIQIHTIVHQHIFGMYLQYFHTAF